MRTIALGGKLNVSICCLGTMTWGEQNTEEEAWQQLDYAVKSGINFIDTAEVDGIGYFFSRQTEFLVSSSVISCSAESRYDRLDRRVYRKMVGKGRPRASQPNSACIEGATKKRGIPLHKTSIFSFDSQVSGYSDRRYLTANRTVPRGEPLEDTRLTRAQIFAACDASLRRLQVMRALEVRVDMQNYRARIERHIGISIYLRFFADGGFRRLTTWICTSCTGPRGT
jgi:hypothetical protein